MEEVHFLRLSDEILVHIFNFVPFIDHKSVHDVCKRFRMVITDKVFQRNINLSHCYRLANSSLKSILSSGALCKNIQVLNLNGCYWILRADLMTIGKLVNLKQLHILHCRVSLKLLLTITKSMSLGALSWTATNFNDDFDAKEKSLMENLFASVEQFIFHLKFSPRWQSTGKFAMKILSYCTNLQRLEVIQLACDAIQTRNSQSVVPVLNKLRSLNIHIDTNLMVRSTTLEFCMKILSCSTPGKNWLNFWIAQHGGSVFGAAIHTKKVAITDLANANALSIDGGTNFTAFGLPKSCEFKCRKLGINEQLNQECMEFIGEKFPHLREIIMNCKIDCREESQILTIMSERWKNVTHLNLKSCYIPNKSQSVCAAVANMKALVYLSINGCLIATKPSKENVFQRESEYVNVYKKRRIGVASHSPDDLPVEENSGLGLITKGCPLVQYFDVSGMCSRLCSGRTCANGCPSVRDEDLHAIFQWKYLKSLILSNLPSLRQCAFLIAIAKNCPLEILRLQSVGGNGICTYNANLVSALNHCTNLVDFSLIQSHINLHGICAVLLHYAKLVRLLVIDRVGDRPHVGLEENFIAMLKKLKTLQVFFLIVNESTQWCQNLQTVLNARFLKKRPPLCVHVSNKLGISENTVFPDFHIQDMLYYF